MRNRTQEFIDFCEKNGRLPRKDEQGSLRNWAEYHKKSSPEIEAMYKKYRFIKKGGNSRIDRTQELIDFCKKNKRLPRKDEQNGLSAWAQKNKKKYPKVEAYLITYSDRGSGCNIDRTQEVIEFYQTFGRLPRRNYGSLYEQGLANWAKDNVDLYPKLREFYGETKGRIPAEFILPWVIAKAEYDLCAKYAFTTELKKEMETEIMKQNIYTVSEAELILKKLLGSLSRDPRWYDIPENRADLIASVMQKEKED